MKIISSVETKRPAVALTFDDGPHATYTEKFMELFAREKVRATFFEIGNNVREHPALVRRLVEAGHEVGNHSMSHPFLSKLNADEIREELLPTQKVIQDACGMMPKTFRAPYLDQDERVAALLEEMGLFSIGASRLTDDWNEEVGREEIVSRSADDLRPGDIVVLHTWRLATLEGMPEIIRRIQTQGFACVTVSELMNHAES